MLLKSEKFRDTKQAQSRKEKIIPLFVELIPMLKQLDKTLLMIEVGYYQCLLLIDY